VHIHANDREGREKLFRYILRPPLSLQRLSMGEDGRLRYQMKRNGALVLSLTPVELLAKARHAGASTSGPLPPLPWTLRATREVAQSCRPFGAAGCGSARACTFGRVAGVAPGRIERRLGSSVRRPAGPLQRAQVPHPVG
jgi:hypothetical protein